VTRFDTGCACCRDDFYDYEEWLMQRVSPVAHPLAQTALTTMRDVTTRGEGFRAALRAAGAALAQAALADVEMDAVVTEATERGNAMGPSLARKNIVFATMSSAGRLVLEGARTAAPFAPVVADDASPLADSMVVLLDATLAGGDDAIDATTALKARGATDFRLGCALAAPEGVEKYRCAHPDVSMWTIAIDSHLDSAGNIVPGVGDVAARVAEA
jgi:uracil phosphoribosyltransferase